MKTPIEIAAMPLIERQILVADLRNVPVTDKLYAVALQLISAATNAKGWKDPDLIEVKNIAGHDITVDKTKISKDGTAKIFPWQYLAVRRFVEPTDEDAANESIKPLLRIPGKNEGAKPITRDEIVGMIKDSKSGMSAADVAKLVSQTVLETLKAAGIKVAALILFTFLLCFAGRASAQTQSYMVGSTPGLYHAYSIAGLNGGTNTWVGTNSFVSGVTNVLAIYTNANWSVVNGQATNNPTYTTNTVVNYPGEVSVVNYDLVDLYWGFDLDQSGTAAACTSWDYSPDGVNWQTNALFSTLTANGQGWVSTNINLSLFAPGYIRLDYFGYASTSIGPSNVVAEAGFKPKRTGP